MPDVAHGQDAPKILSWSDLTIGMSARATIRFSKEDLVGFAALSGDRNPIHLDAPFAQARGFQREVVYGGLIFARLSRLLGMELPGRDGIWMSGSLDFRDPLHVDEEAELVCEVTHLSDAIRTLTLRVRVTAGARTIAKGTAQVVLREAPMGELQHKGGA